MAEVAAERIAVIGAGISGIAAAHMFRRHGYEVVLFEKSASIGGVWAQAYPGVRLQNIWPQYHFSDFAWPATPDLHPTGEQIMHYLQAAVDHFQLDVRQEHEVLGMDERPGGWAVRFRNRTGEHEETFGYVVISVGQYTDRKHRPAFPGQAEFQGQVLTERDIVDLAQFDGKRVVVVGFGKSALDMVTFAAPRARCATHLFRTPRWMLQEHLLGVHFTHALFSRFGSVMMTSWAHPTAWERALHKQLGFVVGRFWRGISALLRFQTLRAARGEQQALQKLGRIVPDHGMLPDLRSAAAIVPEQYYALIAADRIDPRLGELAGFTRDGVVLADGATLPADLVVLSVGSETPTFPFLPEQHRRLLECEPDGVQLYRHLIHPRIPRVGFAGFNHGYMHIPAVEIGALWQIAALRGDLLLPAPEAMDESMARVREWKRAHIHFEPSRLCATSTRFQQYIDILLKDLGLSPYRKLPNVLAEVFGRYSAADYRAVSEEFCRARTHAPRSLAPLPVDT